METFGNVSIASDVRMPLYDTPRKSVRGWIGRATEVLAAAHTATASWYTARALGAKTSWMACPTIRGNNAVAGNL